MASAREGRCETAELAITTLTLLEMTSPCTSHLPPVSMEIFFNSRPEAQRPRYAICHLQHPLLLFLTPALIALTGHLSHNRFRIALP
ncbi:hypothetical protein TNIN_439511 [Trichonephila inaurata madagascariensis]|uniref:Uncharacterized protein n=1 Tax=Trichonephila inaurata madagascariensis TaxID=2747483 RepID=A0A8X7CN64_9ARAC|nr:hypothetical protein TNIN_439511 [Trichonephila inaurata madagascariensis]